MFEGGIKRLSAEFLLKKIGSDHNEKFIEVFLFHSYHFCFRVERVCRREDQIAVAILGNREDAAGCGAGGIY